MARPKEFDRETALDAAIAVFGEHGFEGTSTDTLLGAMGIARQSLYDTFGDKRALYLAALRRYNTHSIGRILGALAGGDLLEALERVIVENAMQCGVNGSLVCMGTAAIWEFGQGDAEISAINESSGETLGAALERMFTDARKSGAVAREVEPRDAAALVSTLLMGLKAAARGGVPVASLKATARLALRALR
jgi:AcrR family transcriptional regulator